MRPLFAIAPLAVVLALLGPTSQASQTNDRSWTQTLLSWAFDQDDTGHTAGSQRVDTPRSFSSLIDRVTH